ncbi:cation channel sperm-associated protein 4 [Ctenodactylus gundi]
MRMIWRQQPVGQMLINRHDILSPGDAWEIEDITSHLYIRRLLLHPIFQLLLALLLLINIVIIALSINDFYNQKYYIKHYELFSVIDDTVLIILICEVFFGWLDDFWIFWKDGWNTLNFFIVFTFVLAYFVNDINIAYVTYSLRVLRLVRISMAIKPLARIICVILQSTPFMVKIMIILFSFMLTFSVLGVLMFSMQLPAHFDNVGNALYTLFICLTLDGWLDIYSDFQMQGRGHSLEIKGAIYLAVFIITGAYIGLNLFLSVVTIKLENMRKERELERQQHQVTFREAGEEEKTWSTELSLMHCEAIISEKHDHPHELHTGAPLQNLSEDTHLNFGLVLEAIEQNLMEYKEIRKELNM